MYALIVCLLQENGEQQKSKMPDSESSYTEYNKKNTKPENYVEPRTRS